MTFLSPLMLSAYRFRVIPYRYRAKRDRYKCGITVEGKKGIRKVR
jgi:hypothetical protein